MDNALINLSRRLYEFKQENNKLNKNNTTLNGKVEVNEVDIITNLEALTEVYELVLGLINSGVEPLSQLMKATREMVSPMAKVYASLIERGIKTINDVPENLKAQVEYILGGK